MNRFDRVTALLLLLQTRSVVTAQFLADHFGVTERTIYRDIRTLENAGVPLRSEAGLGYSIERGYRLPPVSFTFNEATALLMGEKLLASSLDANSLADFNQALNKIRAVMDTPDKDALTSLDANIEAIPTGAQFPEGNSDITRKENENENNYRHDSKRAELSGDKWLRECRNALAQRQVINIYYHRPATENPVERSIEPIGLFYYSWHWHLIAWCRLREGYRDFRLDRILSFELSIEHFSPRSRLTLKQYLAEQPDQNELHEIEIVFNATAARFVDEQRYLFGFIDEEQHQDGVKMRFLTHVPDYMARWLLQYTDSITVVSGETVIDALKKCTSELVAHYIED